MSSNYFVNRALQFDLLQLDSQFVNFIAAQIGKLRVKGLDRLEAELRLILQSYLWYRKQYLSDSSLGLDIFGLRFCTSRASSLQDVHSLSKLQKYSFLCAPLLTYFTERFSGRLSVESSQLIEKLCSLFRILEVINSFVFVYNGRYRTIHERLCSIRIEPLDRTKPHSAAASFTFLNREVLWRSMSQVLTLALPHLLNSAWPKQAIAMLAPSSVLKSDNGVQSVCDPTCCPLCTLPAHNAVSFAQCTHTFCYYCLAVHLSAHSNYQCNLCKASIYSIDQLTGRVT